MKPANTRETALCRRRHTTVFQWCCCRLAAGVIYIVQRLKTVLFCYFCFDNPAKPDVWWQLQNQWAYKGKVVNLNYAVRSKRRTLVLIKCFLASSWLSHNDLWWRWINDEGHVSLQHIVSSTLHPAASQKHFIHHSSTHRFTFCVVCFPPLAAPERDKQIFLR